MEGITRIGLHSFRSYERAEFRFSSPKVLLLGPNGSGKSNLLEAIGFLSVLRSFRGARSRELFRVGSNEFTIRGELFSARRGREVLTVHESAVPAAGGRRLMIGNAAVRRASEFIREFRVVSFAPEDRALASGASGCRRRFFDMLISMLSPEYFQALIRYQRALAQRNRALKSRNEAVAASFECEAADSAARVMAGRREYAAEVEAEVRALLAGRSDFTIEPRFSLPETAEEIRRRLAETRAAELKRGCSSAGPQIDDFEFVYDERSLRYCGSTGQHRLISLLLKIAEFDLMKNSASTPVIVMADDVTGELDRANRDFFFEAISRADQCFFAAAERSADPFLKDAEVIPFGGG